jgi:hypothetical protein
MKAGRILVLLGKLHDVDLGKPVDPEEISPAELKLGPAVLGSELVPLDDDQVHGALLVAQIPGALDEDIALNIAHPDVAPVVVALGLRGPW